MMPALILNYRAIPTLTARQSSAFQSDNNGKRVLSTTAIGFLVPIFVAFIVGPFLAVWFIRRRRERRIEAIIASGKPRVEKRETAKRKLEGCTKVVSRVSAMDEKGVEEDGDNDSISERECTICLSTLYAPSPPKPLKLKDESPTTVDPNPTTSPTESPTTPDADSEEEILRLQICSHEFHAECLTSWVLMRRYTCPICRAVFWKKEEKKTNTEEGVEAAEGGDGRGQAEIEMQTQIPAVTQMPTLTPAPVNQETGEGSARRGPHESV